MRVLCTAFLLILAAGAACAGTPKGSALEDWKAHRAVDHADTLIVAAPLDTTWQATLAALRVLRYDVDSAERSSGHIAMAWGETTEFEGEHGAEWMFTSALQSDGGQPALSSPDCPGCWFTVIHDRLLVDAERIDASRTRVIARKQFVGTPRGKSDPIALESTGLFERALLKRIRERMGL